MIRFCAESIYGSSKTSAWSSRVLFLIILLLIVQGGCGIFDTKGKMNTETVPATMPTVYQWNCGVNAAYVTLRLFHRDVAFNKLGEQLRAGPHFEQEVSFFYLKRVFEKNGLIAKAYQADYTEEILEFCQPTDVAIVKLNSCGADRDIGHFIIVRKRKDSAIVINPPHFPIEYDIQEIIEEGIILDSSGEFLLVSDPEQANRV